MKISFVGDIALNDYYIVAYKIDLNPFSNLQPVLASSDFVIGNLECMAKGEQGENLLKKPRLTTTVETLNYLNTLNVNIVSLANNHIYDHLEDGFLKTTRFLEENKIQYLGASLNKNRAAEPTIITQKDIKIGFLNYVTNDTNPNLPSDAKVFLNVFDLDKAEDDIKRLKQKVDHIVILLHWGGRVEGGLYPDFDQPKIARKLIDTGADLIIGHHSHTIQPYEVYKGKYIFYSLGNFCFSDYWFEGEFHTMPQRRMISAIIGITFSQDKYQIQTDYFINEINSFSKIDNYKKKIHLRNKIFSVLLRYKPVWYIYYFQKQIILPFILFFNRNDLSFKIKLLRLFRYISKKFL